MSFAYPGLTHCEYCGRSLGMDIFCNCEKSKDMRKELEKISKEILEDNKITGYCKQNGTPTPDNPVME